MNIGIIVMLVIAGFFVLPFFKTLFSLVFELLKLIPLWIIIPAIIILIITR